MPKTLIQKLQMHPAQEAMLLNADASTIRFLEGIGIQEHRGPLPAERVFLFAMTVADLQAHLGTALAGLSEKGILWICFPKGSSGKQRDLTRDTGWEVLESQPLRYLSLISMNEIWSGFAVCRGENRVGKTEVKSWPEIDLVNRIIHLPPDLETLLLAAGKRELFQSKSFTFRKEAVLSIVSAQRPETRQSRLEKVLNTLG